jgi:hypothetical protein
MEKGITYVGLDAHKEAINVAMPLPGQTRPVEWQTSNDQTAVRRMVRKAQRAAEGEVRFCYEAGPCGYALQRWIRALEVVCVVVAPSLIPRRSGQRVKTDRRDARKLAELFRAGLLTEVHPPTEEDEAVRDLCRAREDAHAESGFDRHPAGVRPARRLASPERRTCGTSGSSGAGQLQRAGIAPARGTDDVPRLRAIARPQAQTAHLLVEGGGEDRELGRRPSLVPAGPRERLEDQAPLVVLHQPLETRQRRPRAHRVKCQ